MNFVWLESARAELRAIDRETAIRILHVLTEYSESGRGDIKALTGAFEGYFRIRIGDYRVIFSIEANSITVIRVRHRSEIYR